MGGVAQARRFMFRILVVAGILGATLLATKTLPANAVSNTCPSGWTCFWPNANYGPAGTFGKVQGTNPSYDVFSSNGACKAGSTAAKDNDGSWIDCISSIQEKEQGTMYFYAFYHCGGAGTGVPGESNWANLAQGGNALNDAIRSDSYNNDVTGIGC